MSDCPTGPTNFDSTALEFSGVQKAKSTILISNKYIEEMDELCVIIFIYVMRHCMNFSENDFCFSFACEFCAVRPCVRALVQFLSIIHLFGTPLEEFPRLQLLTTTSKKLFRKYS